MYSIEIIYCLFILLQTAVDMFLSLRTFTLGIMMLAASDIYGVLLCLKLFIFALASFWRFL